MLPRGYRTGLVFCLSAEEVILPVDSVMHLLSNMQVWGPGACFSKVPKLFGPISGDLILFVSSKRRRLEARNFAVIFIFIPFTTYEKTSFTESAGRSLTNGFSGPKSFRDFRETGPRPLVWTYSVLLYRMDYLHRGTKISFKGFSTGFQKWVQMANGYRWIAEKKFMKESWES